MIQVICLIFGIVILINYIRDFNDVVNNRYSVANININQIKINETTGKGKYQYIKLDNGKTLSITDEQYQEIARFNTSKKSFEIYYLEATGIILKIE